jgi:signal peptidase I
MFCQMNHQFQHELMLKWLRTRWQIRKRHAMTRSLLSHVQRVLNYRRGQLSPEQEAILSSHGEILKKDWRTLPMERVEEIHEYLASAGGNIYPIRQWTDTIEAFLMAIIVAVGFRAFFVQTFTIPTNSMRPSYHGMTAELADGRSHGFWGNFIRGITHYAPQTRTGGRVFIPLNDRAEAIRDHSLISFERISRRSNFFIPRRGRHYQLWVNDEPVSVHVPAEFDLESTLMERFCPEISSKKIADAIGKFPLVRRNGRVFLDTGVDVAPNSPVIAFNLQHGDVLFVERLSRHFRSLKRGDAVVFATWKVPELENDDRYYIKRLVGMPGDVLSVSGGKLLLDGLPANDAPAMEKNNEKRDSYGGYFPYGALAGKGVVVPDGHFFVMGDNSANSYDSRFFGAIPEGAVAGRPLWVFFPRRGK